MRNYRSGNHLLSLNRLFNTGDPPVTTEQSGWDGDSETTVPDWSAENKTEETDSDAFAPFESEPEYSDNTSFPSRLFSQIIVVLICLILVMLLTQSDRSWTRWIRQQLHSAVNASSEATFGYIARTPGFQKLAQNLENLVRIEEITKKLSEQHEAVPEETMPVTALQRNAIWPVEGRIVRNFGWQLNGNQREFYPNLEFAIVPGTEVLAIRNGTVSAIHIQPQSGGVISLDHGNGLISTYRYLNQLQVRIGQSVSTGTVIGRAAGSILSFELLQDNRAIDPLRIIGNQYAAN